MKTIDTSDAMFMLMFIQGYTGGGFKAYIRDEPSTDHRWIVTDYDSEGKELPELDSPVLITYENLDGERLFDMKLEKLQHIGIVFSTMHDVHSYPDADQVLLEFTSSGISSELETTAYFDNQIDDREVLKQAFGKRLVW